MRKLLLHIFTVVILSALFFVDIARCLETLHLTTFAGPPLSTEKTQGFYDLILTEAFRRSDIAINISHLPAERSLINADSGITDGDFVRIAGLEKIYPNLIRVPEKITDFEFMAFTKNQDIHISVWEDCLKYNMAIVKGWKILEVNLAGARTLKKVKDQKQLFILLANDRADAAVYSRFEGYGVIKELKLTNILTLEPPLAVREMYLYLNKRHRDLILNISENLLRMKKDGTFERIRQKTLRPYLAGDAYD